MFDVYSYSICYTFAAQLHLKMACFSAEKLETLKQEFLEIDTDGSGEVSIEELGILLRSMRIKLKISESQVRRALKQIDINGDGTVSGEEMLQVLERFDTDGIVYKALNERSTIRKDFLSYDTDGSGYISKDEFIKIIKDRTGSTIAEDQLELMMIDVDENNDNKFSYDEFVKLMLKFKTIF